MENPWVPDDEMPEYFLNDLISLAERVAEAVYDFSGDGTNREYKPADVTEYIKHLNLEERVLKVIRVYQQEEKELDKEAEEDKRIVDK